MVVPRLTYCLLILVLFSSCQKEEIPISPFSKGDAEVQQIELGDKYERQVYFSLEEREIISANHKVDWDLAFESSAEGWRVTLNAAKLEAIHKTQVDFDLPLDIPAGGWVYDDISGNLELTAIGNWIAEDYTYLLDRGYNEDGEHLGYKKFVLLNVTETAYTLKYANLDGALENTKEVFKNPETSFTQFSFNSEQIVNIEPPKESWDLLFTHYTEIFEQGALPYLVSGALSNRNGYEIAEISSIPFSEISMDQIEDLDYDTALDAIGYDWKAYNFETGLYEVNSENCFIIKRPDNRYFKLHFIDFYNATGEKGAPKFEYQEL